MTKSIKASLLSAFVFPGLGHYFLKKPLQGSLLTTLSVVCLYFLISTTLDITNDLIIQLQQGDIPLDITLLAELIKQELTNKYGSLINLVSLLFFIVWIIGILDSYRLGHIQDQHDDKI